METLVSISLDWAAVPHRCPGLGEIMDVWRIQCCASVSNLIIGSGLMSVSYQKKFYEIWI